MAQPAAERPAAALRGLPLNSVRNRLVLLFFAITTAAVGFVYLYVVPQLRSSLTAEKLQRQEAVGSEQAQRLSEAIARGASQERLRSLVRGIGRETDSRVTLLGLRETEVGPMPAFVIADSQLERTATLPSYLAAASAASTGTVASAVEVVDGRRVGETAVPLSAGGRVQWAAVLSTPLAEVDDNVALIERQILIAGAIALAAALLAGYLAARAHSRRLRGLEQAAEKVAEGDFKNPIPVTSNDEVGQLALTFNEMQQRLARLDSARKEFIANASHELRTPIFSLGGFVELLEHEKPDAASRREFVRTMREQVERLEKLTADLLDLSKLDADAVQIRAQPLDLSQLAAEIAGQFEPAAEQHDSQLEIPGAEPARAIADPDRVAQIMRILLDNALAHTPEGTQITVTTQADNGAAELVISDDGPGIDSASRSRVFERFYTGDAVSGSGLGLAIARELALLMGGTLNVSSRRGQTSFTLRLPGPRAGVSA